MPKQIASLKSTLASSKTQRENNALYQTILGLIENLDSINNQVTTISSGGGGSSSSTTTTMEVPHPFLLMGA